MKSDMDKNNKIKPIMFLLIVVALAGLIFVYIRDSRKTKILNTSFKNSIPDGYTAEYFKNPIVDTYIDYSKPYIESLKSESSDIDGMTKYDKYSMGLFVRDGSDTDGDGLTDKEEIEAYNSDPLKTSSSDDLYSDGYKVSHGMNLAVTYEFKNDLDFPNNECSEVVLVPKTASDFGATVKRVATSKPSNHFTIIAEYLISGFGGSIEFEKEEILKGEYKDFEIAFLIGKYGERGFIESKHELRENGNDRKIILLNDLDKCSKYKIYVVRKVDVDKFLNLLSNTSPAMELWDISASTGRGLICGMPFLSLLGDIHMKIYVEDFGDYTILEKQALVEEVNRLFSSTGNSEIKSLDDERIIVTDLETIQSKYKWLRRLLPSFEYSSDEDLGVPHMFYAYKIFDSSEEYSELAQAADIAPNKVIKVTGFDIEKDELPFHNFGSYISPGGNCAGFARLTSLLYNKKSVPLSGSYKTHFEYEYDDFPPELNPGPKPQNMVFSGEHTISWKINGNSDVATVGDPGLSDCKDSTFVQDNEEASMLYDGNTTVNFYGIDPYRAGFTNDDRNLINMIGSLWAEQNDNTDTIVSQYEEYNLSWKTIENIMSYIDNDKVVNVAVSHTPPSKNFLTPNNSEQSYHAVTLYGYEYSEDNPNVIIFYVYDSNYPHFDRNACQLEIVKDTANNSFDYYYALDQYYAFSSYITTGQESWFAAIDDDLNNLVELNP